MVAAIVLEAVMIELGRLASSSSCGKKTQDFILFSRENPHWTQLLPFGEDKLMEILLHHRAQR